MRHREHALSSPRHAARCCCRCVIMLRAPACAARIAHLLAPLRACATALRRLIAIAALHASSALLCGMSRAAQRNVLWHRCSSFTASRQRARVAACA